MKNKRKIVVKPIIHQNSASCRKSIIGKIITDHKYESWKLLYSSQKKVTWPNYYATIKHFEPRKLWKNKQLWGLRVDSYFLIKNKCSRPYVFYRKTVLNIFDKFTGKHLQWSSIFSKSAEIGIYCRCFPVHFTKSLRKGFFWTIAFEAIK